MATETLTRHTCDRCGKVYSETATAAAKLPPPALHLEVAAGTESIPDARKTLTFQDLCTKCTSRVGDLVTAMMLSKDDGAQKDDKPLDPAPKTTENKKPEAKATDAKVTTTH